MLVEEPLPSQVITAADEPVAERLDLPTVLAALADPGRLAIVRALADQGEECCNKVGELAGLTVGKSTLSHHMKVLRESGVTRTRAQGTHRYVSLRRVELDQAFPQLLDAVLGPVRGSDHDQRIGPATSMGARPEHPRTGLSVDDSGVRPGDVDQSIRHDPNPEQALGRA